MSLGVPRKDCFDVFSCRGDEPKSGLARDLGDCLQSRNVPFGTSGDLSASIYESEAVLKMVCL